MAHVLMENRHGLVADFEVTEASGTAERDAAVTMLDRNERRKRKAKRKQQRTSRTRDRKARSRTLSADKGSDTRDFVEACRQRNVTPHVAQNQHARRRSAIDCRTTRHPGYRVSQTARLLVEKIFAWAKVIAGFRRSRYRGRARTRAAGLLAMAAFNLLRITKLERTLA